MGRADLLNRKFGRLKVVEETKERKYGCIVWKCLCDCGGITYQTSNNLLQGNVKSCGCLRSISQAEDLTGQRFGMLLAIKRIPAPKGSAHNTFWLCRCDCGTEKGIFATSLKSKKAISCGCYRKARGIVHNMSHTRLYKIWRDMKSRCDNPNTPYYKNYGGRGITYCDEWGSFECFKDWAMENGYSDALTLDRKDVYGNYEPDNCRWLTNAEQQLNKRTNHILTYAGKSQTIKEWADELGIKYKTLCARIDDYHWSDEKALTTPVIKREREKDGVKN